MPTISFTTAKGAKVEINRNGGALAVTINGVAVTSAHTSFEDRVGVTLANGAAATLLVPKEHQRALGVMLDAIGKITVEKLDPTGSERFGASMRGRMYSTKSDH